VTLDAAPTGPVLCTGLGPGSTLLRDKYAEVTQAMLQVELREIGIAGWQDTLRLLPTRAPTTSEEISARGRL
jgi:hypothetical protein